ncbi:hypothetical protein Tco_1474691 [Tanacetum coccineum]
MGSTVDFTKFAMHRLKKDRITRVDLQGPAYKLLKETCKNNVKLEYIWSRNKERKYASSLTKIKVARISVDKEFGYGYSNEFVVQRADQREYTFREADFERLHLNDIEDMFLLYVQHKLHNLTGYEIVDLIIILRMFTQSIVIKRRIEDVQLGVENYPKNLNITRPQTTCDGISYKDPYTIVYEPRGVVYQNTSNQKRLMRVDEIYKFCNITLKSVYKILNVRLYNLILGYNANMSKRAWTGKDQTWTDEMLKLIDNLLLERRIMWSLECFVGGRTVETDYGLLMQIK